MAATPLILGQTQRADLLALRSRAAARPIDMPARVQQIATPDGMAAHRRQMDDQTVEIPIAYLVTFSIETGHPAGPSRHLSMSSGRKGRTPTPEALWLIAEALGFAGGLAACHVWPEALSHDDGRTTAINVVQPLSVIDQGAAALGESGLVRQGRSGH